MYPHVREVMEQLGPESIICILSATARWVISKILLPGPGVEDLIEDFESYGNTGMEKYANIRLLADRKSSGCRRLCGRHPGRLRKYQQSRPAFYPCRYGFGKVDPSLPYINGMEELPEIVKTVLGE